MKRGYAVSGMLYTILVLFMALLLSFLYTMQNKKNILDKLKAEVVEAFYCSSADNLEDLRGSTVVATNVTEDGDNALIQLPKEGHYDTTSYLSVPIDTIQNEVNEGNIYYLGSGTSFDIKSLLPNVDYTKLTADNFVVEFNSVSSKVSGTLSLNAHDDNGTQDVSWSQSTTISKNYLNGVLSISGTNISASANQGWNYNTSFVNATKSINLSNIKVYLIIGEIESL